MLILDNASIHRSREVQDLCERTGVKLEYLPPYSPDYNPIELVFNTLKAWIRRYYHLAADFNNDWEAFLRFAIEVSGCDRESHEYFRHAHITEDLYIGKSD